MSDFAVPPHDIDAEGAVLSACLLDPGLLDELRDALTPADFYSESNRRIWETALALVDSSRPVDAVTIASELRDRGRIEQVGGTPYIAQLLDATPSVANVHEHARTVSDLARRRRVISTTKRISLEGYTDVGDTGEWCQRVEADVLASTNDRAKASESSTLSDLVSAQVNAITARRDGNDDGPVQFARVRWQLLRDKLSGGWRRGKFHVLAGRPGMGKTAAALGCASGAARFGEGVVFISLEMTREELTQRMLSSESRIPLKAFMDCAFSAEQWNTLAATATEVARWPMSITHCPGATVTKIRSIVRREIARVTRELESDVTLVVIDYLQLIDGERRKGDSRESEVSEICRRLTALAGELNVAMMVLSQLNREVDKRPDKRPELSDLRESGAIEQDAYSVSFLYRDEYYNENTADAGMVEWILRKHRNGSTGWAKLRWDGECVRMDDLSTMPDGYEDQFDNFNGAM